MAQIPELTVPTVAPTSTPIPRQEINAPPGAFGANVLGEALGDLGKAADTAGTNLFQYAEQFQAINNKQAADTAFQTYSGLQDKMVADFKSNNTGVDPKTGQPAAITNMPDFYKDLEQLRADTGSQLSRAAQVEYDANTRRNFGYAQTEITNFAVDQRKTALVNTQLSLIKQAQDDAAANIGDTARVNADIAQIAQAHATLSTPQYNGTPEATSRELLKQDVGAIFASGIKQQIDAGDIPTAQAMYEQHKGDMTFEQSTTIAGFLKSGAIDFTTKGFAEDIAAGRTPANRTPLVTSAIAAGNNADIKSAIWGQESGQNPNAPTSSAGAVGFGQIEPKTFAAYAKPGEDINNPTDNQAVSARIIDHYTQEYHGDAARVAVAYYSGEGNVAPEGSPTPWKRDIQPKDGPPVSGYVQQVLARTGAPASTASQAYVPPPPPKISPNEDPNQIKSDYDSYIQTTAQHMFADNPTVMYRAIDAARNQMSVRIQSVATAQDAAYHRLEDAVANGTANGRAVGQMSDLNGAYPGASGDLSLLPPASRVNLGLEINRAAEGIGGFKTPEMEGNAELLRGLATSNPAVFADPVRTNLINGPNSNLSASDRAQLQGLQRSLNANQQAQAERSARLNSYLANPIVAAVVKQNFPDKQGDQYMQFVGALDGMIERVQTQTGKPPTQDQISDAAKQLVGTHGGFLGFGATPNFQIPPDVEARIRGVYQQNGLPQPSPDQLARDYEKFYAH